MTDGYRVIVDKIIRWGKSSDKLEAALMIGSQARDDHGADEYSDMDVLLVVSDPDYFLFSDEWLAEIGTFHVSFIEDTFGGGKERRLLFDGALDVDFIILTKDETNAISSSDAAMILKRGYRVLVDKIGMQNTLPRTAAANQPYAFPTEREYRNLVNDFWYHAVWAAKKLKRGELWTAKDCVDTYMKWKLLSMIECHAHALHGPDYDTWHNGRFLEAWAEGWIIEKLARCFSRYDEDDVSTALLSTMDLYRTLALEVAAKMDFLYQKEADDYVTGWGLTFGLDF